MKTLSMCYEHVQSTVILLLLRRIQPTLLSDWESKPSPWSSNCQAFRYSFWMDGVRRSFNSTGVLYSLPICCSRTTKRSLLAMTLLITRLSYASESFELGLNAQDLFIQALQMCKESPSLSQTGSSINLLSLSGMPLWIASLLNRAEHLVEATKLQHNLHFLVSWKAIVLMGYACERLQFTHQPRGLKRILQLCILSVCFQFFMMN